MRKRQFINIFLCLLLSHLAWGQVDFSPTFTLQLEKDEQSPAIHIEQEEESDQIVIKFHDTSGIDTVWIDEQKIPVYPDTLKSIPMQAVYNKEYLLKAVDIRGNKVEQTFLINWEGTLLRGGRISTQTADFYTINDAEYYALLIGVENYTDPDIDDLYYPIDDVEALYNILTEDYTFSPENVEVLKNPTKAEIGTALDALKEKVADHDNLLIFFAGHGLWNNVSETGSWLPADARENRSSTWVKDVEVHVHIKEIESRHTLLITDACFAGSILNLRDGVGEEPETYNKLYSLRSRKVMTSAPLEQVPDKSVFIKYLLKYLEENKDNYLPAESLYNSLKLPVLTGSGKPPQYGMINDTFNEGGDFIFIRRQPKLPPSNE